MDNNQMNGNNNNNNNNNNRNNKNGQMFLAFLLVSLVMLFIMSYVNSKMDQMSSEEITYSRFLKMVEEDKVESVETVSYTHLDVYKRQDRGRRTPGAERKTIYGSKECLRYEKAAGGDGDPGTLSGGGKRVRAYL